MIMKRIITLTLIISAISVLALSAGTGRSVTFSPKDFKARITHVYPANGMPPRMDETYYLTIKDGKIQTFLPFIGTDESPVYGGDPSIDVDCDMEEYSEKVKKDGKELEIKFKCTDSNHLHWEVSMTIFEGETINARFHTNSRSQMNYTGEICEAEADSLD